MDIPRLHHSCVALGHMLNQAGHASVTSSVAKIVRSHDQEKQNIHVPCVGSNSCTMVFKKICITIHPCHEYQHSVVLKMCVGS